MGADYSFYVKFIATRAPTFIGYIISVLASVKCKQIVPMYQNKYQYIYFFSYLLQRMDQAIYSSTKVTLWLWLEIPRDEGTLSLKNTITLFMFLSNIWNWKDQSRFMYFCVPFQTMEKYIVYLVKEFIIYMYMIYLLPFATVFRQRKLQSMLCITTNELSKYQR